MHPASGLPCVKKAYSIKSSFVDLCQDIFMPDLCKYLIAKTERFWQCKEPNLGKFTLRPPRRPADAQETGEVNPHEAEAQGQDSAVDPFAGVRRLYRLHLLHLHRIPGRRGKDGPATDRAAGRRVGVLHHGLARRRQIRRGGKQPAAGGGGRVGGRGERRGGGGGQSPSRNPEGGLGAGPCGGGQRGGGDRGHVQRGKDRDPLRGPGVLPAGDSGRTGHLQGAEKPGRRHAGDRGRRAGGSRRPNIRHHFLYR